MFRALCDGVFMNLTVIDEDARILLCAKSVGLQNSRNKGLRHCPCWRSSVRSSFVMLDGSIRVTTLRILISD